MNTQASIRVATWTQANGGDELKWKDMNCVGSDTSGYFYEYYVRFSDHNNEKSGLYFNDIYTGNTYLSGVTLEFGSPMTSGYERVLPDGDYIIAAADNTAYYLDIQGSDLPATLNANVALCNTESNAVDPPEYDIWSLSYSNGFYSIRQKGSDMCLDLTNADASSGANIAVHTANGSDAQKWAITQNSVGYRIQSKCSGFSVDVKGAAITNGTNIQSCKNNDSIAQRWVFIPYKPAQPVPEGKYYIFSALDASAVLDVAGNSGDIPDQTNLQILNSTDTGLYDVFELKKLSNGYYIIIHELSGKAIDIFGAPTSSAANVSVHTENDSAAQQFAIMENEVNGGYTLIARCSGMALDVKGAIATSGTNVEQYYPHGSANQTWIFYDVLANSHTVTYDANGGINPPKAQKKIEAVDLLLSSDIPECAGYSFAGWAASPDAESPEYAAGAVYSQNEDITLYAVWNAIITTESVADAKQYHEYHQKFTAGDGSDSVVWKLISGNLPEGLVFDEATAELKGIPSKYGSFNFTLQAGNDKKEYTLFVERNLIRIEDMPEDAIITDHVWTYDRQEGWNQIGSGTHVYAYYPSGFNATSRQYASEPLSSYETESAKRTVSGSSFKNYIYWHWAIDQVHGVNNYFISDVNGSDGTYSYPYFTCFESAENYGLVDPNGRHDSEYRTYYCNRGLPSDGSYWWFRFDVYQQTYVDYEPNWEHITSDKEPVSSENIKNITHYVEYILEENILTPENFPDANFLAALKGQLGDSMTAEDASKVTELYVTSSDISDMTGLEFFTGLERLFCGNNALTTLDVSKNTSLRMLYCYDNALTTLVSKNAALHCLSCYNNALTALDVSENTELLYLYCGNNALTTLDLSENTAMQDLNCEDNYLTTLDLSKNIALQGLGCRGNLLTTLDVSRNTALRFLDCGNNALTELNLGNIESLNSWNISPQQRNIPASVGNDSVTIDISEAVSAENLNKITVTAPTSATYDAATGIITAPTGTEQITYAFNTGYPYEEITMTVTANLILTEVERTPFNEAVRTDYINLKEYYLGRISELPTLQTENQSIAITEKSLLPYAYSTFGTLPDGVSYEGTSLTLDDDSVMMRFFFTAEDDISDSILFEVNGDQIAPVKRGQYLTVDVDGLSPAEWDTPYSIALTTEEDYWCISYSVLSYAYRALSASTDADLQHLVRAMVLYCQTQS